MPIVLGQNREFQLKEGTGQKCGKSKNRSYSSDHRKYPVLGHMYKLNSNDLKKNIVRIQSVRYLFLMTALMRIQKTYFPS